MGAVTAAYDATAATPLLARLERLYETLGWERQLTTLNRELVDTNRAVTALLAELGQQAQELRERAAGNASFHPCFGVVAE